MHNAGSAYQRYRRRQSSNVGLWVMAAVLVVVGIVGYALWDANRQEVRRKIKEDHEENMRKHDEYMDDMYRKMGYSENAIRQERMIRALERKR